MIPDIIWEEGKQCVVKEVSDEEFLIYMEKKLFEELQEYAETKSSEELADLLEVTYRMAELQEMYSVNGIQRRTRNTPEKET